ncbi:hypothetical protein Moror_3236 [Moniliophthora roreri MCA 2997]|uniref:Uncharacterized protein n=1 Tax=Moniliophthora roreri (strain MCA 2997) TaxID=1381753 RepID=V2WJA5_MONRO|nr:hypothetical protein Moror_3236 [Moniliophthora roreri MCA 2997]
MPKRAGDEPAELSPMATQQKKEGEREKSESQSSVDHTLMSCSQESNDSQDPTFFPSQTSPVQIKRSCLDKWDVDGAPCTPRPSATNCYKKLKSIEKSRMLDEDLGSQEWLEGYLGQLGLEIPDHAPASGDSDIEEGAESQVTEENLEASVFY